MFQHSHIMQCSDFNKPVSTKNPKSNVLFLIQFLVTNWPLKNAPWGVLKNVNYMRNLAPNLTVLNTYVPSSSVGA